MENNKRTKEVVDQFISDLQDDIQAITIALRKIILDTSPQLNEEFKWSMPNYCYLQTSKKHVNFGFHRGKELEENHPNYGLDGAGKALRYIKIKNLEEIQPEAFKFLIKEAMALNEK